MRKVFLLATVVALTAVGLVSKVNAAVLFVEPHSGVFQVGSMFDVSVYLDTQGKSVNAISVEVRFSPDKLQVVNPSSGQSVVGIWSELPVYNNQAGTVNFTGAIPKGITASRALLSTLTFRARSTGSTSVRISDESRVLLNDGRGTDALQNVVNANFSLALPPPAGPIVFSSTHPDQDWWYKGDVATFSWEGGDGVTGYSYVLNEMPIDTPDSILEGNRTTVSYKNFKNGAYFFHIKALRNGLWGGVTHYAVHNDAEPPAAFKVNVLPGERTVRRQPVLQFQTSDALSGISHYELKLVRLTSNQDVPDTTPLFFEVQSPYITPELELGSYDVILRATDLAGNIYDAVQNFQIVETLFGFADEGGILFRGRVLVSWGWVIGIGAGILLLLIAGVMFVRRWHKAVEGKRQIGGLPGLLREQLDELKRYRERYGKILLLFFALTLALGMGRAVFAQETLSPPVVSAFPRAISDDELFYVTGEAKLADSSVVIYLQNEAEGTVITREVAPDEKGGWFYQHPVPLESGEYVLWLQARVGEAQSPPSAQYNISVSREAFRLGPSRISYETVYLYLSLALFLGIVGMSAYLSVHGARAHRKRKLFLKEIREAEESIVRGFAVLRRDIQVELALVRKAKMTRELTAAERAQEDHLLKDLAFVEQRVKKEVWDLERVRPEA